MLPAPAAGMPFVPVEFAGLTVTPYVNQAGRLAYSLKASGVRAPGRSGRRRRAGDGGMSGGLHLHHAQRCTPASRYGSACPSTSMSARCIEFYGAEPGGRPFLSVSHGDVSVHIGPRTDAEVTAEDARIARKLADQAASYAAEVERLQRHGQPGRLRDRCGVIHRAGRQERAFLPPPVSPPGLQTAGEVSIVMRNVTGEQLAQVDNPDPFASPVWRSPVYRTPEGIIWLVQLIRLVVRVVWFLLRHPLLDLAAGLVALAWLLAGWPGPVVLAAVVVAALVSAAAGLAALVRPAGVRPGPQPVAVVVLPAALARRA